MMTRDLKAILDNRPMTVEQRAKFSAIRDKYVELSSLIDDLVVESKARTKSTDLLAESAMWSRTAVEQIA